MIFIEIRIKKLAPANGNVRDEQAMAAGDVLYIFDHFVARGAERNDDRKIAEFFFRFGEGHNVLAAEISVAYKAVRGEKSACPQSFFLHNGEDFVRSVARAIEKNGRGGVCKSRPEFLFPENGSCHLSITPRKTGCSKIVLAMSETPIAFG